VDKERVESMIMRFGEELGNGPFIQKKEEMLGQKEYLASTKEFIFTVLDRFEKLMHS
jgi:hypothetical protein